MSNEVTRRTFIKNGALGVGDTGPAEGPVWWADGQPATTHVAFGGDDWKTLYFTRRSTLFSVNVKIAGIAVPARKRPS